MDQFEKRWLAVRNGLKDHFGKKPNLEAILFLIGIQEVGKLSSAGFTKEQKQDLMHVGVCTLLSQLGYYSFSHYDSDGWPHFHTEKDLPGMTLKEQETILKEQAILYFEKQQFI